MSRSLSFLSSSTKVVGYTTDRNRSTHWLSSSKHQHLSCAPKVSRIPLLAGGLTPSHRIGPPFVSLCIAAAPAFHETTNLCPLLDQLAARLDGPPLAKYPTRTIDSGGRGAWSALEVRYECALWDYHRLASHLATSLPWPSVGQVLRPMSVRHQSHRHRGGSSAQTKADFEQVSSPLESRRARFQMRRADLKSTSVLRSSHCFFHRHARAERYRRRQLRGLRRVAYCRSSGRAKSLCLSSLAL